MPSIVVPVENIVIKSNYETNLIIDGQEIYTINSTPEYFDISISNRCNLCALQE